MQVSWLKYLGALGFVMVAAYQFMSGDQGAAVLSIGTALALAGITKAVAETAKLEATVPVAALVAPAPDPAPSPEYHAALIEAHAEIRRLVDQATEATRLITSAAARVDASAPPASDPA